MRWKWIAGIALLLIVALVAALCGFLYTFDYNTLKPRIARMVKDATGRELEISGDIDLALGLLPALEITDLSFANAPWGSQPQMIRMDKLQARVQLLPLLSKDVRMTRLAFAGVEVLLETKPDGQGNWEIPVDESPAGRPGASKAFKINAGNIRLQNLVLTYRDGKTGSTTRVRIADLQMVEPAGGDSLAVDLKADYNGQPLTLAGTTGPVRMLLESERFGFELSGAFSTAALELDGAIDDALNLQGIDVKVQTSGKNLAELKLVNNFRLPETNTFNLTGRLQGSKKSLALNDISGNLAANAINLAFSGNIEDLMAINGIDLQLKGSGKDLAKIAPIVERKLPATDAFAIQGRLTGSVDALSLEEANGSAGKGGIRIVASGGIKDLLNWSGVDLNVKGSGKNLAELGTIVDKKLPATDEFTVAGRLTGSVKVFSLLAAQATAKRGRLDLALSGKINDLLAFKGVDLMVKGSGRDLAKAGTIFHQKLPATDEFTLEGQLVGSAETPALINAKAAARRGRLHLSLNGGVKNLRALGGLNLKSRLTGTDLAKFGEIIEVKLPTTDGFEIQGRLVGSVRTLALQQADASARRGSMRLAVKGDVKNLLDLGDMNLHLQGSGKNLADIGPITGKKLPPTDTFFLEGRLTGTGRLLSLHEIKGHARRGSLNLAVEGAIGDLPAFRQVDLRLKGSGKNLVQAASLFGKKLPPTDDFFLQGRLTGSAAALSLREARGQVRRGSLRLQAAGAIKDLAAFTGMDLRLKAGGQELAEIGPLVGATLPELGPFSFSGHLYGSVRSFALGELDVVIDQSDFNGRAKVEVRRRPKITLALESSLLDMTALMKNLAQNEKDPDTGPAGLEGRLFSRQPLPFDALKQVDADVVLNARNIRARDANFELGRLSLTLENGDLDIDTLQATYKQTKISGNLHIYPESPPRVATKFLVQDFDLGGLLRELRISEAVRSHLDIAVDAASRGISPRDLMAGLNGSVGAVMGEGYLTRYLDLLSVGLTGKVIQFWGGQKKGGEIRCAAVQFDVRNGLAASRTFVFDTEAGVLTGEGDINLDTEQINFLLVPEPRHPSLMNVWSKLRVSGTLMDPKVRPDTVSLLSKGAKALSALVVGPLGLLAPFVSLGAHKAHPCSIQGIGK